MKPYVRILGISSHWEKEGEVPKLLEEALAGAEREATFLKYPLETRLVHLVDVVDEFFHPAHTPQKVGDLLQAIIEADGVIFASPIVGGGATDRMKTLLCHLYRLEYPDFSVRGKPFGVIVHGKEDGGREAAHDIASELITDLDMVPPAGNLFYRIKDGADKSEGGWMKINHRLVGQNLLRFTLREKGNSIDHYGWRLREYS